jgi:hypothetical protein
MVWKRFFLDRDEAFISNPNPWTGTKIRSETRMVTPVRNPLRKTRKKIGPLSLSESGRVLIMGVNRLVSQLECE